MAVPAETLSKLERLSSEDLVIVTDIIDQMVSTPLDMFNALREEGIKHPLTEEEVDDFVHSVREERRVTGY